MAEKLLFTLNDLYKTLKHHDTDILKHFDDENLSDFDYLFYAINSDIMSNGLSIVINLLFNNETTSGIDNNARALIEGFTILKMLSEGDISDVQLKIFRSHFYIVEFENFKKWIKNEQEHPFFSEVKKRYDNAIDFLKKYYNCTKKDLLNYIIGVDDPLFYLKKTLKDNISFTNLLYKYPIFGEKTLRVYEFFSIMIHPRYENSLEFEKAIQNLKKGYLNVVLNYLIEYLKAGKLLIIDKNEPTFEDDFSHNQLLKNNVNNIEQVNIAFSMLIEDLCILKNGSDGFDIFYLKQTCSLLKDMMLCESLGYNEQVISKFKSFIEMASIYGLVNSVGTPEEYRFLKRGFMCSSRLQLVEHLKSLNLFGEKVDFPDLIDLFEHYYSIKFNISSYEKFLENMKKNSLYFLNLNEDKNYNQYVKNAIIEIFENEIIQNEIFGLYKLSKDMNHASGYNFNSNPGISEYYSHVCMHAVFTWLINFVLRSSCVVEKEDHKPKNVGKVLEFFELLLKSEIEAAKIIGKKYEQEYNK